jgi:molecular chaperone GrpE
LLPVVDSIELALNHKDSNPDALAQGVEMVAKLFHETLTRNGLEPISAQGQTFDPELHEAMMRQPDGSVPADTVLQEFQKGYRIGDVILRHAKVVVSAPPEPEATEAEDSAAPNESAPAEE